jgi:phage/plasmid-like protein (TIGR03299 family)
MPDAVETMAYVQRTERDIPWHKLGTPILVKDGEALPDGPTMQKQSGLLWGVHKQPLFTVAIDNPAQYIAVNSRVAIVRDTDNRVLGTVGPTYQPIQNTELFDFADALMKADDAVRFETAGSLYDGRVVWALAVAPERAIKIDGDPQGDIMPYLVLATGHDGLRALQVTFSPTRVVCANTLNMALRGSKNVVSIRHTVNAMSKVETARKALRINVEYLDTLAAVSKQLMKQKMSIKDVLAATEELIPSMSKSDDPEKAVKAQAQRDLIVALYRNSDNLDGVPETAYRFVQAVAEYADHDRTYRKTKKGSAEDARALAILDGTAQAIKENALRLVLPAAGARGRFTKALVG